MGVGNEVCSRGRCSAARPCSRARPSPPSPRVRVLSAGGGAAGTRSPRSQRWGGEGGRGAGVSTRLAGAARPGGEVQGVPARREGGAAWSAPAREEGGPESPWAPARNTQLIITSRKTPWPRPPETPALRNPPQPSPPWAPRIVLTSPAGFSLSSPQVPALGHHP